MERARCRPAPHRAAREPGRPDPRGGRRSCCAAASPTSTLLGDENAVRRRGSALGLDLDDARIVSPTDPELVERFAQEYAEAAGSQGDDRRAGPRGRHRHLLLRHDDGAPRPRRRHGLRCRQHDRPHHPAGAGVHQDRPRRAHRVERVPHVPRRPGARLRRLRRHPRPDDRAARRHRDLLGRRPPPSSASTRAWRCCPTRPGRGSGADVEKVRDATALVSRARSGSARSRGRSSTTPPIDPDVGSRQAARIPTSPAGRPSSSSPTSTRATTPTRRCSAAPTPSRSVRCCRGCASRSTTSRAVPSSTTSSTPSRSPPCRPRPAPPPDSREPAG